MSPLTRASYLYYTMSIPHSRITTNTTNIRLSQLVQDYDEHRFQIPPHQREFCWDLGRQQKFIQSILKGYPIPSILMSKRRTDVQATLEDGRQRITTASRFRNNLFGVVLEGLVRKYEDLTALDQLRFDVVEVTIMTFMNATDEDRIQIFDWHQNGAPLSPGERYHAHHATPLIAFVKAQLMTPGSGYHDRAAAIWGIRGDPVSPPEGFITSDKRRKWLLSATALVLGLTFGPANATKKYEPEKGFMTAEFPPAKQAAVCRDLERILEIYEAVDTRCPARTPRKWLNAQWDLGNFTGYILYSLSTQAREAHDAVQAGRPIDVRVPLESVYRPNSLADDPDEWVFVRDTWIEYLVRVRREINENPTRKIKAVLEKCIHAGLSAARSWTNERWEDGYLRVFGHEVPEAGGEEAESYVDSDTESDD